MVALQEGISDLKGNYYRTEILFKNPIKLVQNDLFQSEEGSRVLSATNFSDSHQFWPSELKYFYLWPHFFDFRFCFTVFLVYIFLTLTGIKE